MLKLDHTIFDFKSPMTHFASNVHVLMHAGIPQTAAKQGGDQRLKFGSGLILAAAANYALFYGMSTLIWGATKDDGEGGKYDYTQEFCDKLADLVATTARQSFRIIAPFAQLRKFEIVGRTLGNRADLFAKTWSCKDSDLIQCGECHPCIARRAAARFARLEDRTPYIKSSVEWPFTDEQMANVSSLSPADFARVFGSEKPHDPVDPRPDSFAAHEKDHEKEVKS